MLGIFLLSYSQITFANNGAFIFGQTPSPLVSSNPDGISIISVSTAYNSEEGAFRLFGEIKNVLDTSVENISLNATFYDTEGNMIGSFFGQPYLSMLRPDEKSGFNISVAKDASALSNYSYYTISKTWESASVEKPGLLRLRQDTMSIDSCGVYHIGGVLLNGGPDPATDTILSGAFYNGENQVIASAATAPSLKIQGYDNLLPSAKSARFDFTLDNSTMKHFAYFSINAQSKEYASRMMPTTESSSELVVFTDSLSYPVGTIDVTVNVIVNPSLAGPKQTSNDFAFLTIMSESGNPLDTFSAFATGTPGQFSRTFQFHAPEGSEGKLFTLIASYNGHTSQTTFSISRSNSSGDSRESGQDGPNSISENCNQNGELGRVRLSEGVTNSSSVGIPLFNTEAPKLVAGSEVTLSLTATNELSLPRPITIVLQVLDSEGVVVFIHIESLIIESDSSTESRAIWTPDRAGSYKVKSFMISDLDEPIILSSPSEVKANIQ